MTRVRAAALAAGAILVTLPVRAQVDQGSFDQNDPFASRFHEKSHFQIHFKKPKPGGEVKITANTENCHDNFDVCRAEGDVVVVYQDITVKADSVTFDRKQNAVHAEGHVILDQGATRMSGQTADFDFGTKTGAMTEAEADLEPTYHIVAKSIQKTGEATYVIDDGIFSACPVPHPAWSFAVSHAAITLDDYARMHGVAFRTGPVPVLYTPYLVWPTKVDRASGFLVPGLGYNSQRGAYLGLTYYWVTGRPTDATIGLDLYSRGALGLAGEFRWAPSPESAGVFQGFVIHDPLAQICVAGASSDPTQFCTLSDGTVGHFDTQEKTRWKLRLDEASTDLPYDMRGVVSIRDYSDINYLQDFERSYALNASRQISSTAFLTKNFEDTSVNLRLERTETFFFGDVLLERMPSLEFTHRTAKLGSTPFYLAADASLSNLFVDRGTNLPHGSYGRADLHPILSLPFKGIPWLSVNAQAGARVTYYSDTVTPYQTAGQSFTGDSLTRRYEEGRLSLVGPSFSRIYDFSIGPFVKWKHVIEPRIEYNIVSDINDLGSVPAFDEIDSVFGQSSLKYSLVNRLLAKKGGDNAEAAQEVASLELSQTYNFENPQTVTYPGQPALVQEKRGPAEAVLRISPGQTLHVDAQMDYDTKFHQATSYTLSAAANWKTNSASLSWSASRPILTTAQPPPPPGYPVVSTDTDYIRAALGADIFKTNIRFDTQLNYDVHQSKMIEDRSLLSYKGSCYTVFLEVRNYRLEPVRHDYRIVINLKDIGTLLDVNGGIDRLF